MVTELERMEKTKAIRIALLVSAFPKVSETFIVSKFTGLLNRGWDVHLVCNQSNPESWAHFPELIGGDRFKKHFHLTWVTHPKWLAGLLLIPALVRGLFSAPRSTANYLSKGFKKFGWNILKKYYLDLELIILNPDVIHFEFGSLAVEKTYLKELLGCKLTVSFRGYDLNFVGLDRPDYYAQVWKTADACHFLGKDLWRRALRRGCSLEMTHQFIPPAIDLCLFHPEDDQKSESVGTSDNPIKILSVGRLEWKKGYEFAFQAIRELLDQGISVLYQVIGEGNRSDALYFARHQLGLEESVEFCGSLTHIQVIQHLNVADILLHSSLSEGFCNAVLEAQAMQVPVVCTDVGGLPENVVDGMTGFVVPRRNPQAMAEKLLMLVKDPSLRHSMGTAGCARVQSCFQIDQQLDSWERFYRDLS